MVVELPTVHRFTGAELVQIAGWKVALGDGPQVEWDAETGLGRGYHLPGYDDSHWEGTSRLTELPFGFPTWEPDSYTGYLWARTTVDTPAGFTGDRIVLRLGSALESADGERRLYIDGSTPSPAFPARYHELVLECGGELGALYELLATPGEHQLVVQQRTIGAGSRCRPVLELEGWRHVDLWCHQSIAYGEAFSALDGWAVGDVGDGDVVQWSEVLGIPGEGLQVEYTVEGGGSEAVHVRASLRNEGPIAVSVSHVDLATVDFGRSAVHGHYEGAYAYSEDGWVVGVAHPGGLTTVASDTARATSCVWLGITLEPGERFDLPPVVIAKATGADGRSAARRYIVQRARRDATEVSIFDPYGWYQISHASEPKRELDDALIADIDDVLTSFEGLGTRFDYLSLDCGWNDPDDLSRFSANLADDGASVRALSRRHGVKLMLWVSPSDGPRAFRHELGLANPGLEGCSARSATLPWRLCPSAEPWHGMLVEAIVGHATRHGVRGLKLDGTELWCSATEHGHRPGVWSVFHNSQAVLDVLAAAYRAGVEFVMLYWGLRSPWWALEASTVWDRGYLVEAAAPAGAPAWTLRHAVLASQDAGTQSSAHELPAHLQDSLGVWFSDTAWASWQGMQDWDDALVMDAARGSRLLQPWGDLRGVVSDGANRRRWRQVMDVCAAFQGEGEPFLGVPWEDGPYGYRFRSEAGDVTCVVNRGGTPVSYCVGDESGGDGSEHLSVLYASRGAAVFCPPGERTGRVVQTAGSVAVCLLSRRRGGVEETDRRFAVPSVNRWERTGSTSRPLDPSDEDERAIAGAVYRGRGPRIEPWMIGVLHAEKPLEEMAQLVPWNDRSLMVIEETWTGAVEMPHPGELAIVVTFRRSGAAWHDDRLHQAVQLALSVDGEDAPGSDFPERVHEQAGSWSWVIRRQPLDAGSHRVDVHIRSTAPASVEREAELWARCAAPSPSPSS